MAKKFNERKSTARRSNDKIEEVTEQIHEEKQTPVISGESQASASEASEDEKDEKVGFSIKLPRKVYDRLTDEKKKHGMSRAAIILFALRDYWNEQDKENQ